MKIKKAVITAAGPTQRALPLQTLVDRDGVSKSALAIIVEEAVAAGVEDIAVVIVPGDQEAYARAAGEHRSRLAFVEQHEPRGYGHALYCASSFLGAEPFLHLISDHPYISRNDKRCAHQLVDIASTESCPVSAGQATRENMLPYYGPWESRRVAKPHNLFKSGELNQKTLPTKPKNPCLGRAFPRGITFFFRESRPTPPG